MTNSPTFEIIQRIAADPALRLALTRRLPSSFEAPPGAMGALGGTTRGAEEAFEVRVARLAAQDPELEKIVLETGRPAFFVREDRLVLVDDATWNASLSLPFVRSTIEAALRSVGRVEIENHPDATWLGTAWVIAPGVAITNRHVAEVFARRSGDTVQMRKSLLDGQPLRVAIDFAREHQGTTSRRVAVESVLYLAEDDGLAVLSRGGVVPMRLGSAIFHTRGIDWPT